MDHIAIQNQSISLDLFNKIIGRPKLSQMFVPMVGWEQLPHKSNEEIQQAQLYLLNQLNRELSIPIEGTNLILIIKLDSLKIRKFCHVLNSMDGNYIDSKECVDKYNYLNNQELFKNYMTGAYDLIDSEASVKTYIISHYGQEFWDQKPYMVSIGFSIKRVEVL